MKKPELTWKFKGGRVVSNLGDSLTLVTADIFRRYSGAEFRSLAKTCKPVMWGLKHNAKQKGADCLCGMPAVSKGMCRACYSRNYREEQKIR